MKTGKPRADNRFLEVFSQSSFLSHIEFRIYSRKNKTGNFVDHVFFKVQVHFIVEVLSSLIMEAGTILYDFRISF